MYSWAGEVIIAGHFWILATNKPAYMFIHISSRRKSTNLLPQDFRQFYKTWKIVMTKESQNQHAWMSPRSSHQIVRKTPKSLDDEYISHWFLLRTTFNHSWPLCHWALMPKRMQSMVLSCMWGPGRLMLVQPGYCTFVWREILTCPNYMSTPIHSFSICELLVCK
jgi:hypothetical protein